MGGLTGCALFKYNYSINLKEGEMDDCISIIEKSFTSLNESIKNKETNWTYAGGIAGFAYAINYLERELKISIEGFAEFETYCKKIIYERALAYFEKDNYDYFHGGIGMLYYLIYSEFDSQLVNQLSSKFISRAIEVDNDRICWKSINNNNLVEYNLGLSHGMASIISILTKLYENGNTHCYSLISKLLSYYREQTLKNQISIFPAKANIAVGSRLAWCYGDLGIARSIWLAGHKLKNESWKLYAIEIMLHAAKRKDLQKNGVVDAGICHGTSGIAHIFSLFYKDTGIKDFKVATDYWIEQTLMMAKFDDGLAGFKSWQGHQIGWVNEYGFLEGVAGIGLVLNSYLHPETESSWDRFLLLS